MIAATVVLLISGCALAWVLRPALAGPETDAVATPQLIDDAEERKVAALIGIIDLEEERDVGKLSDADFASLKVHYEFQALDALRELDELRSLQRPHEDEIEAEIARLRAELTCADCGAIRRRGIPCPGCGRN